MQVERVRRISFLASKLLDDEELFQSKLGHWYKLKSAVPGFVIAQAAEKWPPVSQAKRMIQDVLITQDGKIATSQSFVEVDVDNQAVTIQDSFLFPIDKMAGSERVKHLGFQTEFNWQGIAAKMIMASAEVSSPQ